MKLVCQHLVLSSTSTHSFPSSPTSSSLVRMPRPNTTSRTMAPCCLQTRPQITGFFIQSLSIRRHYRREFPATPLGTCSGNANGKELSSVEIFIFCLLNSLFPSENVASCSIMLWVGYLYFSLALCHSP